MAVFTATGPPLPAVSVMGGVSARFSMAHPLGSWSFKAAAMRAKSSLSKCTLSIADRALQPG